MVVLFSCACQVFLSVGWVWFSQEIVLVSVMMVSVQPWCCLTQAVTVRGSGHPWQKPPRGSIRLSTANTSERTQQAIHSKHLREDPSGYPQQTPQRGPIRPSTANTSQRTHQAIHSKHLTEDPSGHPWQKLGEDLKHWHKFPQECRRCANVPICRLCMMFLQYLCNRSTSLLWIWARVKPCGFDLY